MLGCLTRHGRDIAIPAAPWEQHAREPDRASILENERIAAANFRNEAGSAIFARALGFDGEGERHQKGGGARYQPEMALPEAGELW